MKPQIMGEIVDTLATNGIVCKKIASIDNAQLQSRKKIACFLGVDATSHYVGLWRRFSNSRLVMKEAEEFFDLQKRLEDVRAHRVLKNILIVQSPVCSKALHVMKQKGWKVVNVSV